MEVGIWQRPCSAPLPRDHLLNPPHIRGYVCKGTPVAADELVRGGQTVQIQEGVVHALHGIPVDGPALVA